MAASRPTRGQRKLPATNQSTSILQACSRSNSLRCSAASLPCTAEASEVIGTEILLRCAFGCAGGARWRLTASKETTHPEKYKASNRQALSSIHCVCDPYHSGFSFLLCNKFWPIASLNHDVFRIMICAAQCSFWCDLLSPSVRHLLDWDASGLEHEAVSSRPSELTFMSECDRTNCFRSRVCFSMKGSSLHGCFRNPREQTPQSPTHGNLMPQCRVEYARFPRARARTAHGVCVFVCVCCRATTLRDRNCCRRSAWPVPVE